MQRVVLVLRDETRAKRAEQSRVDFVANATHELRSPLVGADRLHRDAARAGQRRCGARDRFLGIMQAEAQRMARLVEDLMSLSRVEINEHVPPRAPRRPPRDVWPPSPSTLAVRAEKRQMTIALECPRPAAGARRDRSVDAGVP